MKIDKRKFTKIIIVIFSTIMPLIVNLAVLLINGHSMSLTNLVLNNNDEVYWHAQTAGMVRYGMPQGFFGYNGSYAGSGTFGAWGVFPFLPYALLGKIFGWTVYSRHIFSLVFLSFAILLFILMTEIDTGQILLLDLAYCLMPVTIGYSLTAMNEGERYSLGIIIAGMLIRLYRKKCNGCFACIVVPLVIVYSVLSYDIMLLCVPVYFFALLRKKKISFRILISMLGSGLLLMAERMINNLTSAEYNIGTGPRVIETFFSNFNSGFFSGITECIRQFYRNLARFGPRNIINISGKEHGFYSAYLGMYVMICIMIFIVLIVKIIKKKDIAAYAAAAWFIWGFAFAYGGLYTDDEASLIRGINCGLIMGIFILIALCSMGIWRIYYLMAVITMIPGGLYISGICESGYQASEKIVDIESRHDQIAKVMKINTDSTPWKNTIAYYGTLGTEYLEIPDGFGLNYMLNNKADRRMGWAVINRQNTELFDEMNDRLHICGFELIYENEDFYIYKNSRE